MSPRFQFGAPAFAATVKADTEPKGTSIMTTIGIIGAGIAGLHHALFLQKHGIQVTLYTDRSADEMRKSRLPNTVALMGTTRSREIELGIKHWDKPELSTHLADISIAGDHPIAFRSSILEPLIFIDMRLYVPTLMADFEKRGGKTVVGRCSAEEVGKLAADHDLMVVTTGRAGLTAMFPRIPERSPYDKPQRRIFAGLFRGVSLPSPFTFNFNIIPGLGEVFESQFVTHDGPVTGITIEAVPGGALEALTHLVYDDDPAAFNAAVLAVLRAHAPATYARVDPRHSRSPVHSIRCRAPSCRLHAAPGLRSRVAASRLRSATRTSRMTR